MTAAEREPIHEFRTRRRVEFADTDLSGLVHFSRLFIFMETAEHQLIESLGTRIHVTRNGEEIGWPRVAASCEYLSPIRFGDDLDIRVLVERKGERSMTYGFRFERDGRLLAHGRITAVCCVVSDPAGPRSIPIPPAIADRVAEAGEEASDD